MTIQQANQVALNRIFVATLGGAAGLALWVVTDNWDNSVISATAYLAIFVFVIVYSLVVLALAGPAGPIRALVGALFVAVPVTLLASLAGLRYVVATDILDSQIILTAILVLVLVASPFLSVWLLDRRAWLEYGALFDTAWVIAVRYTVAWMFVGVFWVVVFLSNALLELVDVGFLESILDKTWAVFALTGAALGMALAVVYELRAMISPYLILRLLRLMVPPVLAVLLIFLVAVPMRGLSQLFGEFSSATTLMGAGIAGIFLVTTALDRDDSKAVKTRGIRLATQGLTILLPLLLVLAVWSVVLRVQQYGWTPERVLAAIVALFLLAYGVGYAGAVMLRVNWMARIRQINVGMALVVIIVASLWMTPVLNAYRIAVNSQISLFEQGKIRADQLALWEMQHDWGRAGLDGIRSIVEMTDHPNYDEIEARLDAVRTQPTRFRAKREVALASVVEHSENLAKLMPVRPRNQILSPDAFTSLPPFRSDSWLKGCRKTLTDGRPGCVLIWGEFTPDALIGSQAVLLILDDHNEVVAHFVTFLDGKARSVQQMYHPNDNAWLRLQENAITLAQDDQFQVLPRKGSVLHIGDVELVPGK